jgi:hypothetical protein
VTRTVYRVFVDEAGVRAHGPRTSQHFVMSAAILPDPRKHDLLATLAQLRVDFRQPAGHTISFKNLSHQSRLHISQMLARLTYLTVTNVVVCKREVPAPMQNVDDAYLYTLRFLLERVSWFVDDRYGQAYVTFAHIDRFKIAKLDAYVELLRKSDTQIRWGALFLPVRMQTMQGNDLLQVADATASATAQAFEPDQFGNVEDRYLRALAPRLYRRPPGPITSYGMKLHPTSMANDPRYAWVKAL